MAAESRYQIQAEIECCVHAAPAVKATVLGNHQFRHPPDRGILLAKSLGQAPVCGGALVVEQASSRQQPHAGTDTRNGCSLLMPAPQPWHYRRVALDHIVNA